MEIIYLKQALKDLEYWKSLGNKKIQKRISDLITAIIENPTKGIGKPEKLKFRLSGCYSRRIDKEHRIVYQIKENQIIIFSMRFHY